jgi:inner membrane protein involved in colicin E2 resistance
MSPFDASSVKVEFLQPWLMLVLAAAGGIIGAVVTGKRSRWLRGALIGVALAVLYYVGLDWVSKQTGFTSLAHAGEAVSFALGFLGSIVGVQWIGGGKKAAA